MTTATHPSTIAIEVEIPKALHVDIQAFLDMHKQFSSDQVIAAAIGLFLLQNSDRETKAGARAYLDVVVPQDLY
jgi:Protein of unknown function (DUF2811)